MVANTHTVIDPRTMVIESLNTVVAYRAMPASTRPNSLAVWTQLGAVNRLQKIQEVDLFVF